MPRACMGGTGTPTARPSHQGRTGTCRDAGARAGHCVLPFLLPILLFLFLPSALGQEAAARMRGEPLRGPAGQALVSGQAKAMGELWGGFGNSTQLHGWGAPWVCGRMTGVKCSKRGYVLSIELPDVKSPGLRGVILGRAIGRLTQLTALVLPSNMLRGGVPSEVGRLNRLRRLDVSNNLLTLPLPASLGNNLTLLTELNLSYNRIKGGLPDSIGRCTALRSLDLSTNSLNSSLPSSLGNLGRLTRLSLGSNVLLFGSIPETLGALTQLQELDLSSGMLAGSVPSVLGRLVRLRKLLLSSNSISGEHELYSR